MSALDKLARAAYLAASGGVPPAQVNRLIEVLETTKSVELTVTFLARQLRRGAWRDANSARILKDALLRIKDEAKGAEDELRRARELLGVFKWLYEAYPRRRRREPPKTFREYVDWCLA